MQTTYGRIFHNINDLSKTVLLNPKKAHEDPYKSHPQKLNKLFKQHQQSFCGIKFKNDLSDEYSIRTFSSLKNMNYEGFTLTHYGSCGTCSSLQDLSVYMKYQNLTKVVRRCSILYGFKKITTSCYKKLGFSHHCANSWFYNAKNTGKKCFKTCVKSWIKNEPFNKTNGDLNDCLQCDEDKSGKAFKVSAGRTRRNSGLKSAIFRHPEEILSINHGLEL